MAKVEILEIADLPDGDGLLVSGTVEGYDREVRDERGKTQKQPIVFAAQAWKSHLYGDHDAVNAQRAADAKRESADGKKAADERTEVTQVEIPLLERHEVLRSDKDRRAYLAGLLVEAARAEAPQSQTYTELIGKTKV